MQLKTLQWNIGGGKVQAEGTDDTLLASYTVDGMHDIIDVLQLHRPDIITLQETHSSQGYSQVSSIADNLGYKYWVQDEYADSHIEKGKRLGQAVISRFPISDHSMEWFKNPLFEAIWEDGSMATSHDKGRTRCIIDISTTQKIEIQTLHTVPFRRFKKEIDSEDAKKVLKDIARKLISDKRGIIQGDFNIDVESLKAIYTQLFEAGFNEVPHNEPTTPRGHHYDHILYRDISCIDSVIDARVKTDHFPIISSFKVDV